jgi:hypothetical protein
MALTSNCCTAQKSGTIAVIADMPPSCDKREGLSDFEKVISVGFYRFFIHILGSRIPIYNSILGSILGSISPEAWP